jgi:hypothetical protein
MENAQIAKSSSKAAPMKGKEPSDQTLKKALSISLQTYISAITSAAMSSKYALNLELSVGLAVFSESGATNLRTKRILSDIYKDAGYKCENATDPDYKTVQRRINVAADLFNFLGADTIESWIGNNAEMAIINSIVEGLKQYDLKSINGVLALVGKPVTTKPAVSDAVKSAPKAEGQESPKKEDNSAGTQMAQAMEQALSNAKPIVSEDSITISKKEAASYHRWKKLVDKKGTKHISFKNVEMYVPLKATKDEILGAAMELLRYSESLISDEKESSKENQPAVVH